MADNGLLVLVEATPTSLRPLVIDGAAVIFPSPGDYVRYAQTVPLPMGAQVVPCLKRRHLLGFLRRAKDGGANRVFIASETGEDGDLDAQITRLSGAEPAPAPAVQPAPDAPATTASAPSHRFEEGLAEVARLRDGLPPEGLGRLRAILASADPAARAQLADPLVAIVDRHAIPGLLELLAETREPRVIDCLVRHLDVHESEPSAASMISSRPAVRAILSFGRDAVPGLLKQAAVEDSGLRREILADTLLRCAGGPEAGAALRAAIDREGDPRRKERLRQLTQALQAAYGN
jgi:hypothetical protein